MSFPDFFKRLMMNPIILFVNYSSSAVSLVIFSLNKFLTRCHTFSEKGTSLSIEFFSSDSTNLRILLRRVFITTSYLADMFENFWKHDMNFPSYGFWTVDWESEELTSINGDPTSVCSVFCVSHCLSKVLLSCFCDYILSLTSWIDCHIVPNSSSNTL